MTTFPRPPDVRWRDRSGFLFTALAVAFGLTAVSSFSGEAMRHGGGAFLIAYAITIVVGVIPVMILEIGVGLCYQGSSPDGLRRLDRRLEWIGWWTVLLGMVAALLITIEVVHGATVAGHAFLALIGGGGIEDPFAGGGKDGSPLGGPVLLAAFLVLALFRVVGAGLPFLGAFAKWLVPSVVVLVAIAGVAFFSAPGAADGVSRMLVPSWSALAESETWIAALRMAFLTQALGLGVYIALAGHLGRGEDAAGSAAVVTLGGACFSLFAGLVISAMVGSAAAIQGVPIEDVVGSGEGGTLRLLLIATGAEAGRAGAGLALIVSAAWAAIGFGTVAGIVAATAVSLREKWSQDWSRLTGRVCLVGFLTSALFLSPAGVGWLGQFQDSLLVLAIPLTLTVQCLAFGLVGSRENLQRHVNAYSSWRVGATWRAIVIVAVPGALASMLVVQVNETGLVSVPDRVALSVIVIALLGGISLAAAAGKRWS